MNNLHLLSTGGVGTYAIEEWGRPYWSQSRMSPHTRSPIVHIGRQRFMYVFGDPRNQLMSFFRRGFMKAPYEHCKHVSGNVKYLAQRKEWTVVDYLQDEYDAYMLYEHLKGWLTHHPRNYDIMFVRYEALSKPAVRQRMQEWVGQDKPFEFAPRASNWKEQLTATNRVAINRMFGPMTLLIEQLPDVTEIRCS